METHVGGEADSGYGAEMAIINGPAPPKDRPSGAPPGHARSTKLSMTFFSPALSKETVSLLPSTAVTFP
jgi:hypothetical protein